MEYYTPQELHERLAQAGPTPLLLDVREPWEYDIARIPGARLIPMSQIDAALDTLDAEQEIVVICHHGRRSQQVAQYLEANGFSQVANLSGGIEAWSLEIDPSLPQY